MKSISIIFLSLLTINLVGCHTSPVRTSGSVEASHGNTDVKVVFSDHDRALIRQHYHQNKYKKVPPGLAKKGKLTPGHQKRLQKHGRLPPGLEGRYLPYDLERRLDRLPDGYVRVKVGSDIVLMETATRIILDVIAGISH